MIPWTIRKSSAPYRWSSTSTRRSWPNRVGAASVAAALDGYAPPFACTLDRQDPVVAIVSGGNIALEKLTLPMRIEPFDMERMQSTWENLVEYDMSESGVRPLTLRELVEMGFDLEAFLDQPLGYSQSNGTPELRERMAALYPGAHGGPHRGHQRHVRSELPRRSEPAPRRAIAFAIEVPNYMQMPGVARSLGANVQPIPPAPGHGLGAGLGRVRAGRHPETRLVYLSNPNNPTGSVLSDSAMERIVGAATTGA